MKIEDLESYGDILKYLEKKPRKKHLLLGNGFSMAYDPNIFSYNALNSFIENSDSELLKKLFSIINTKNFELIMQQLDNFSEIAATFSTDKSLVGKINEASKTLKESLIDAVKGLHPEHVFTIPEEESKACAGYIENYVGKGGMVFSTNYDLLLYWVLMRNGSKNAIDGFGRDQENLDDYLPEDERVYSELRWGKNKNNQSVHYLHGTLPLFDTGIEVVKEEYDTSHYLLDKIKERMERKEYPIFVTAGNAAEKLNHIMHNKYLAYCYDIFSRITGSLITFGFNFGEYDDHIITAINKAAKFRAEDEGGKLYSLYIGVYSQENLDHILSIKSKIKCKVKLYDARTVNVWR